MSAAQQADEFHRSLPRGPLTRHIAQIYAVMLYMQRDHDPNAFEIATHSLREIARYTAEPPRRGYGETTVPDLSGTEFGKVVKRAAESMAAGLQSLRKSIEAARTPEAIERLAQQKHRARITNERHLGLTFVRAEAARVRRELGL